MKRTIDARTPSARNLRLRAAHIGMNGEVLGGQDSLTGNTVTTPPITRDAFRVGRPMTGGEGLDYFKTNKSQPAMRPMTGPMSPRAQNDTLMQVRSAVDAEKARQRARGTAAVKATFPTGASVREDFADNTKSIVGKYGSGFSTPQLPKPAQAVAGSGVTGIMDGYRNAMKAGTGLQKQGPQMKLPDLDPLKKRRSIAVTR